MKAHFNQVLEQQKHKVQCLETQVTSAKLSYSDALRNLEQISDEIHRTRSKASSICNSTAKQDSVDSSDSLSDEAQCDYKCLPEKLGALSTPIYSRLEEVDGYKNVVLPHNISPGDSESSKIENPSVAQSQSSEWTEINLDVSSPEDDANKKLGDNKPKLLKQKTLPNPTIENEFSSIKNKIKLEASISNWISRSSAKSDAGCLSGSRRQSLDNLLGPTGEKVKEIFSQGMMMLNISSLAERRNSEPKSELLDEKEKVKAASKKIPSPLEKTLTYLTAEEQDSSDTESLSRFVAVVGFCKSNSFYFCFSVDMLNEEQINSLMLDKAVICEQVLGTPLTEIVEFPTDPANTSSQPNN